jgi:hypothetical protein
MSSKESPRGGPEGLNAQPHSEHDQDSLRAVLTKINFLIADLLTDEFHLAPESPRRVGALMPSLAEAISQRLLAEPQPAGELSQALQLEPAQNTFPCFASQLLL